MSTMIENPDELEALILRIKHHILQTSDIVFDARFSEMIDEKLTDIPLHYRDEYMHIAMQYGYSTPAERIEASHGEMDGGYRHSIADTCAENCVFNDD